MAWSRGAASTTCKSDAMAANRTSALRAARARPRCADAGDAAGVAGPDDRLDRAAHHRRRARRPRAHLVGGDRVPAGHHGGHAALRQARRPLRPQGGAPGRAGDLPDRLGAVRAGAGDDRADPLPGDPGAGRRRADGQRAGGDRRRRLAARARPLHGPVRRRVRRLLGGGAADRRLLHERPHVALDLLHQHPARPARARGPRRVAARREGAGEPFDRLRRRGAAGRRAERDRAADHAGRDHLRVGIGGDRRAGLCRDRRPGALRMGRVARRRADPAAAPVPQQRLPDHERDRLRDRLRALRRADLPAAVPAGGARRLADRVGPPARPGDGRRADRVDRLGPGDHRHRALQGVPDRGDGDRRRRDAAALAARRRHVDRSSASSRCS